MERHSLLHCGQRNIWGSEITQEMTARPCGKVGWKEGKK
jgi:hypothetical protein